MTGSKLVRDAAVSAVAGYVGTRVMEQVSMLLYGLAPESVRTCEDEARPGPPYEIAVRKISGTLGIELSDEQVQKAGMAMHYALGPSWMPVYALLRRRTDLHPLTAGLVAGGAMSLVVDETLTPALGFAAPNRAYPLQTHLRGIVAHLVFGVVAATFAEGAWNVLGERP
jgi:uncharacterized membrane protein YagU involved in acid resistance